MRRVIAVVFILLSVVGYALAQSSTTGTLSTVGTGIASSGVNLCTISTSALPGATVGTAYTATIQTIGCAAPVTFSISAGSLPSWVTTTWPNSTGNIVGTPVATGSASFTVQATDANSNSATFAESFSIQAAPSGGQPAFPDTAVLTWNTTIANTPSPGAVQTLGIGTTGLCAPSGCTYTDVATAVSSVPCGDTLEVQNTVWTLANGNIRMSQHCDAAHWITIERDPNDTTFTAEGTRVDPCYAGIPQTVLWFLPYPTADTTPNTCARHMPLWLEQSGTNFIFSSNVLSDPGAAYYRFVGIQLGRLNNFSLSFGLLSLLNNAECTAADVACMNHQPSFIIFDRMILQGDAQREDTRGLLMGGCQDCAVLDSWFQDFKLSFGGGGGDANAWAGGIGKWVTNVGRWKIHNNFFNASTEGQIQCGGFDQPLSAATGFDGTPHDIWESGSFYHKTGLMDTQIGQTTGAAVTMDGKSYGPAPDQELTQAPATMTLGVNQSFQLTNWTGNDSNSGINHTPAGTNTASAGTAATVFENVGSGIHTSQNQFVNIYTAPSTIPTGGTAVYTRCFNTPDDRLSTLGHNRQLCAATTFTIVSVTGATSVGPNGATVGTDTTVTGAAAWSNPGNITASDGSYATAALTAAGQKSDFLKSSAYGFSIPASAVVTGVKVELLWNNSAGGTATDSSITLLKAGTSVGSNLANASVAPGTAAFVTYGGINSTWGNIWAPSDINNTSFGTQFQVKQTSTTNATVGVDYERITVYYFTGGPTSTMTVGPQAADLAIQPSYSDAAVCTPSSPIACGNTRTFCMQFGESTNFTTSGGITWSVDGVNGGNSTVGTIDSTGLYCSPNTTAGSPHTIGAQTLDSGLNNISASSSIAVSNSAPIVAFDGRAFTSKNSWELKCGSRILFENSLLELAWGSGGNGGGQVGEHFLTQTLNQNSQVNDGSGAPVGYGPEFTDDITMRNLVFRYAGKGGSLSGHGLSPGGLGLNRYSISNFLMDDTSDIHWGHGFTSIIQTFSFLGDGSTSTTDTGWTSLTNPETQNVFMTHGTIVGHSTNAVGVTNQMRVTVGGVTTGQFPLVGLTVQNNLWMAPGSNTFINANAEVGDCNTAAGTGTNNTETKGLSACWIPHTFDHMALLDSTASTSNFLSPSLIWPIASTSVGFVNYNGGVGGDYRLCTGVNTPAAPCAGPSIFAAGQAHQASDGTALGADITGLTTMETTVRSGVRTP